MNGEKNPEELNQNERMRENHPEGSGQNEMTELTNNSDNGESQRRASKNPKIFRWTHELQHKFLEALHYLPPSKHSPKQIVEFMNVQGLERKHVSSHLQKYRLQIKKFEEAKASYIGPESSYSSKSLIQEYLSESHPSYGIGQSSSLVVNNNDSNNHMYYGQTPIYDVSQAGSNLVPTAGGNFGFSSGVLPVDEAGICNTLIQEYLSESHPSYGIGQSSSLVVNNNDSNNHMYYGQTPIYDVSQAGSNLVPTAGGNFGFSSGVLPVDEAGICNTLIQEYLSESHPSYGIGQSSSLVVNNNDSNNHMYYGQTPIYDVSQAGSNLVPTAGGNFGFSSGVLPVDEAGICNTLIPLNSRNSVLGGCQWTSPNEPDRRIVSGTSQLSEVPGLGQSNAPMNVFGMNSHLGIGYEPSNGNGSLGENWGDMNLRNNNMCNHGSSTESFASTVATFLDNEGHSQSSVVTQTNGVVPRTVFATPQVSQVPLYGQHVTTNNVLDMNPDHSTGYIHSNYTGINTNEHGHFAGNGNVSHGQNYVGTMNLNFDNNNMMSNHGCSTPMFTSPYQSKSNLNAQMNGLVHVPQNPIMPSDHQGIDQIFNNTINSQFNQNNNDNLERNAINDWSFDDVNANTNAEMLNSVASNSGMYVPTPNMNTMNQVQGAKDLEKLPVPSDLDSRFRELVNVLFSDDDDINYRSSPNFSY